MLALLLPLSPAHRLDFVCFFARCRRPQVLVQGKTATVGITDFAQGALGDVVFADLPEVGRSLAAGESFGSVRKIHNTNSLGTPGLPLEVCGYTTGGNHGKACSLQI